MLFFTLLPCFLSCKTDLFPIMNGRALVIVAGDELLTVYSITMFFAAGTKKYLGA